MSFDFPLGWPKAGTPLEPSKYINASVTELFYTNNEIHDLFYRYGFDEVSGNFQAANFGRGGLGGDAVTAFAQDGGGMNNANFATVSCSLSAPASSTDELLCSLPMVRSLV